MAISLLTKSGGGYVKLAPDLTYPGDLVAGSAYKVTSSLDMSGSLQTALSLTGRYAISAVYVSGLTAETCTFKITIDGIVVMNDTFTAATAQYLIGGLNERDDIVIQCDTSFLLEIQTAADTAIVVNYVARKIL